MEGKITFWWLVFFFLCLCSSFFALSRPLKLLSSLALVFVSCLLNFWIFNVCKKGLKNVLGLNPFHFAFTLWGGAIEILKKALRWWMYIQMIIERDTDFGRFLDTTRVLFSSLEYLFVSSKSYKFFNWFFLV